MKSNRLYTWDANFLWLPLVTDSDLAIIASKLKTVQMMSHRNKRSELSPWPTLVLRELSASPGPLKYVKTSCTCLVCVSATRGWGQVKKNITYTSHSSAFANFVQPQQMPTESFLLGMGGRAKHAQLHIGTLVRLHAHTGAKLLFVPETKPKFGHLAYIGPCSHETFYKSLISIGVNYYQYNRGPCERRVFIKGILITLPVRIGVVNLGTRALRLDEAGSRFVLYRSQQLSIYIGELVLEGNSKNS